MEVRPYKIPQSVLVVIYREDGQVLLLPQHCRAEGEPFWQSVTGSKDSLDEDWHETAVREVLRKPASMRWRRTVA
jgi:dATP pyrophosphohydrolase